MPKNKGPKVPLKIPAESSKQPAFAPQSVGMIAGQLAEAENKKTWFERNSTWMGWVYGTASAFFVLILGSVIIWAATKLEKIESHAAEIEHLKELPEIIEVLRRSVTDDSKAIASQLTDLKVKIATLETMPSDVKAMEEEIKAVKVASYQAASDASAAKQEVAATTKNVEAIQNSLAKTEALLGQLKPIGEGLKETRNLVSKIETPPNQTTAVIRIPLRDAKPIEDLGQFHRLKVTVQAEQIPLLADGNKLRTVTITSAELRSRSVAEVANNLALEPNLYRGDGTLSLVVWFPQSDGPPKLDSDIYALLTVSWPDAQ